MKYKKSLLGIAVLAAFANTNVQAQERPWGISINASQVDIDDIDTSSTEQVAGVTRNLNVLTDDDTGFGINIRRTLVGSSFGRLNVELAYQNAELNVDGIEFMGNSFAGAAAGGDVEVESIFARLAYEFNLGVIDPYVGIGIGTTDVEVNAVYGMSAGTVPGTQPPFITDSDSDTSFEARVGAKLNLSDRFDFFLEYTRTEVDDLNFDRLGGGPGGLALTSQEGDVEFDSINFGVTLKF